MSEQTVGTDRLDFLQTDAFVVAKPDSAISQPAIHSIVRNEARIRALIPQINRLLRETGQDRDVTLSVEYFLQNNPLRCSPVVVLIRQGDELVAALYGRQRRVFGIRTGLVQFGDYYGEGSVIAKPGFRAKAFAMGAMRVLQTPLTFWVRCSLKPEDQNEVAAIEEIIGVPAVRTRLFTETVQHILPLKNTFDAFLNTLGSHTRRNLRVYRRRIEQMQWKFVPRLSGEEITAAFESLEKQQGSHKSSSHYLSCCRAALDVEAGSFCAGIRTDTGEWASVAAGWLRDEKYYMLVQLNDARHSRASISTVMRSYLIENLIESGVKVVNFVGGCSEPLRQFCLPQPCSHYLLEKRSALRIIREFIAPRLFKNSMFSRIVRGGTLIGADRPATQPIPSTPPANDLDERVLDTQTARQLSEKIRDLKRVMPGCVIPMQTKGSLPPLYLIHHLGGDIGLFWPLAACLAPERPVFGIQAPRDLIAGSEPRSMESLAAEYLKEILSRQSSGPFHLAGFSTGGVLAFEMARQLIEKGQKVGMLALIDAEVKGNEPAISKVEKFRKIALRKAFKIAFKFRHELQEGPRRIFAKRFHHLWLWWTVRELESASQDGKATPRTFEQALALAENAYRPRPYPGSALLIRFHDEARRFGPDPLIGWGGLVSGGLQTADLPGGHMTGLCEIYAPKLAALLTTHMQSREMTGLSAHA